MTVGVLLCAVVALAAAVDYSDQTDPVSLQKVYDESTSYTDTKAPADRLYERYNSQYNCPIIERAPSRVRHLRGMQLVFIELQTSPLKFCNYFNDEVACIVFKHNCSMCLFYS